MKFFLKLLFILFVTVSLQPAVYGSVSASDTVTVSQYETSPGTVDNTLRTRQTRLRIFFSYINLKKNTDDMSVPAYSRTVNTVMGKSPMTADTSGGRKTLPMFCSFLI